MAKVKTKASTTTKKVTKKPTSVAKPTTKKKKSKKAVAEQPPFFQVRITDQSLYWLIFGAAAILFTMWIYSLDAKVRDLYDQIDINTQSTDAALQMQVEKMKAQQETE